MRTIKQQHPWDLWAQEYLAHSVSPAVIITDNEERVNAKQVACATLDFLSGLNRPT